MQILVLVELLIICIQSFKTQIILVLCSIFFFNLFMEDAYFFPAISVLR